MGCGASVPKWEQERVSDFKIFEVSKRESVTKVSAWKADDKKFTLILGNQNGDAMATLIGKYTKPEGTRDVRGVDVNVMTHGGCDLVAAKIDGAKHMRWAILMGGRTIFMRESVSDRGEVWARADVDGLDGLPQTFAVEPSSQTVRLWSGKLPKEDLARQVSKAKVCEERREDLVAVLDRSWTRPKKENGQDDMSGIKLFKLVIAPRIVKDRTPSATEIAAVFMLITMREHWDPANALRDANEVGGGDM